MPNLIIQLVSAVSAICGLVVINFLLMIYVSVKRFGGSLERRHIYVISTVALLFFLASIVLSMLGNITA
jgi:hypothetical protein